LLLLTVAARGLGINTRQIYASVGIGFIALWDCSSSHLVKAVEISVARIGPLPPAAATSETTILALRLPSAATAILSITPSAVVIIVVGCP
jgi:hypothetical protein